MLHNVTSFYFSIDIDNVSQHNQFSSIRRVFGSTACQNENKFLHLTLFYDTSFSFSFNAVLYIA